MLVTVTRVKIREGKVGAFETLLKEIAETSEALEPGCEAYQCFREKKDSRAFIVVEQYADSAALQAHRDTGHFKAAMAGFAELVDGEPQITFCESLD